MRTGPAQSFLDPTDRRILTAVQCDGRLSLTDLAAEVHLSISATKVRLERLHDQGVITGYTARINAGALGYALRAVVRLRVVGAQDDRVFAVIDDHPQIVRCLRVTGDICFIMEIVAVDVLDLERITALLAPLGDITTDLIYDIITDRSVP